MSIGDLKLRLERFGLKTFGPLVSSGKRKKATSLYLPFEKYEGIAGPITFMRNLKKFLDEKNFPYVRQPGPAAVIFFPNCFSLRILFRHKKRGGKIIQRLDGVYYPSKHKKKYSGLNRPIQEIYDHYSDFVIFQSDYSRKQCFAMFGEKKKEEHTIIINGVDKSIFHPAQAPAPALPARIIFISTGIFRNLDMVEPLIKSLDLLQGRREFEFRLIGPVTNRKIHDFLDRDYLRLMVENDPRKLASLLREAHFFLYSYLNPPCPNSVIEAISCGLPVLGFDSGAMAELLFFGKDLLAPVSNEVFQKDEDFKPEKLAEKINFAIENYAYYKKRALEHSSLYSFEECGQRYLDVFKKWLPA